ncbi:lysophospholipid acyltransferase family protein [Phycicoccus flavus]|uniref:Acyltransferase family protein n=1 Tax=Phycicoccus flavus TaxID=2502783 RepID=A0A8T6RC65_9MICO|nr:lysophospholipid acyltransferase family protein [Phycicoccus flavus]NHA69751.1 acyltransferase family protein [Phycicoccus flavus]
MATPRRGALAAGADRASGERARRRSTPLLGADPVETAPDGPPSGPTPVPAPPPSGSATGADSTTTKAASKRTTTRKAPSRKTSTRKVTTRKTASSTAAKAAATPPAPPRTTAVTPAPAPEPPARKHRPSPRVTSAPQPRATTQAGERTGRPRLSPREKARRDEAARRPHLRLAQPAVPPVDLPPPDPAVADAPSPGGLPLPDPAELVEALVGALRLGAQLAGVAPEDVEARVAQVLAYLRRRVEGEYDVDDFGFDPHFTENVFYPMLRPLYRHWFRVEVRGIENLPTTGGALVVANHSGTVALDSLMVQLAIHDEHPAHRTMRALGADLVFQTPFVGTIARRSGSTLAASEDAERLFRRGELVGVFPEGFKGTGKPFSERYKLQRFGRGGFVAAALAQGVPIVPCSVVGAEEIAPIIGNMSTLARLLGVPYVPVTPTFPWLGPLGLVPLPSKWIIEFGEPIETAGHEPGAAEDPMLVFDLTDQVRETIQQTLYTLLMQRRSVFF